MSLGFGFLIKLADIREENRLDRLYRWRDYVLIRPLTSFDFVGSEVLLGILRVG